MTKFHAWAETEEETQVGVLLSRSWEGMHIVIEAEEGEDSLSSRLTLRLVDVLHMLEETRDKEQERPKDLREMYERWATTKDEIR